MSKSVIFSTMWKIITEVSNQTGVKKSQVTKSEALKMAYERLNSNFTVPKEEKIIPQFGVKKVIVSENGKPAFIGAPLYKPFDVLYVEKSTDVYFYYFVEENYEVSLLTKSHFGFLQTAIWDTMLINDERFQVNQVAKWQELFNKMECMGY